MPMDGLTLSLVTRELREALVGGRVDALAVAAGTTRRRLALLAAGVAGQLLWVSWVWDLGSVSVHWVP